jgi:hypothetical protein
MAATLTREAPGRILAEESLAAAGEPRIHAPPLWANPPLSALSRIAAGPAHDECDPVASNMESGLTGWTSTAGAASSGRMA